MNTLLLLVTYRLRPGTRQEFLQAVKESGLLERIGREEGFLRYEYYLDAAREDCVLLVEQWATEAAQQAHMQTAHMAAFRPLKMRFVLETSVERGRM